MPKGSKKNGGGGGSVKGTPKKGRGRRGASGYGSDSDSVGGDTASVASLSSWASGGADERENGNNIDDGSSGEDVTLFGDSLQDKLAEAIDQLTEKSGSVRVSALTTIGSLLSMQYSPESLVSRRVTLRDYLERILKRGTASEQALAANVYGLSTIQIAALEADMASEDFTEMKPVLQSLLLDHTASFSVRAKVCEALGIGVLLAETCLSDVASLIALLEPLMKLKRKEKLSEGDAFGIGALASPAKGAAATNNTAGQGAYALSAAAISTFSLLITLMDNGFLSQRAHRWSWLLQSLLEVPELDVRLAAGEALAILVELTDLGASSSEDEDDEIGGKKTDMGALIIKLRELATESHKYRAKKDKRQQHHSFRDFLHAVQDGEGPSFAMRFGLGEVLEIDSWAKKRQYDAICKILGSGINRHLVDNPLIRSILELGAPKPSNLPANTDARQAKNERQYLNAQNFKSRSVARGKNRDSRQYMTSHITMEED